MQAPLQADFPNKSAKSATGELDQLAQVSPRESPKEQSVWPNTNTTTTTTMGKQISALLHADTFSSLGQSIWPASEPRGLGRFFSKQTLCRSR